MTRINYQNDFSQSQYVFASIVIIIIAVTLRLIGIGQWSFASDELGTFNEVDAFVSSQNRNNEHPDGNVHRMIPVAMIVHHWGHKLFGRDESGSRMMMSICGLMQIGLLLLGLPTMTNRCSSAICCLLLTIAPEHIFYCQYHRFYSPAALFTTTVMLSGWRACQRQSMRWMVVACLCMWLAMLTQTLTSSVIGSLVLASYFARKQNGKGSVRFALVACGNAAMMVAFAVFYLYPLGKGKAVGYAWVGDTIVQATLSGVDQVSIANSLLVIPGIMICWLQNRQCCIYILFFLGAWILSMLALPKAIPFHSAYLFPLNVPCFVFAGIALYKVSQLGCHYYQMFGWTFGISLLMINMPSLLSYYQDGSRHDFRSAAAKVAELYHDGDRIAFVQGDKFEHYQPTLRGKWERLPPRDYEVWADSRLREGAKLWIIIPGGRSGVPENWNTWLLKRGRCRAIVTQRRFDYHEYPVYVFTLERPD